MCPLICWPAGTRVTDTSGTGRMSDHQRLILLIYQMTATIKPGYKLTQYKAWIRRSVTFSNDLMHRFAISERLNLFKFYLSPTGERKLDWDKRNPNEVCQCFETEVRTSQEKLECTLDIWASRDTNWINRQLFSLTSSFTNTHYKSILEIECKVWNVPLIFQNWTNKFHQAPFLSSWQTNVWENKYCFLSST